ncbi:MAG: hypothetical protein K9K86_09210 [Pseudomonadales bacterium]|nr:hypothetical protein [Pseudomonadales bacterium]
MFLSSITLILQEILEGALLISALLAITQRVMSRHWITAGVLAGFMGCYIFGDNIARISEWFDYVGQEVSYATMQFGISLLLALIAFLLRQTTVAAGSKNLLSISCLAAVALSVTREGSEIYVYLQGVMAHPDKISSAFAGSAIGAGIGISIGILLYYLLSGLMTEWLKRIGIVLLALIGGNMCAQAVLLLTQADWISPTGQLWDTSSLLSEYSLVGRLLYALIGYEATPSTAQGMGYLAAALLILICGFVSVKQPPSTAPN